MMPDISQIISSHRPDLVPYESLYKRIHANPELSFQEYSTADTVHDYLAKLDGFELHPRIGGAGLAAVLRNGPGKTILLRADMDALPVEELSGVPYASKKRMKDSDGVETPVMHACGHDMHVTALLAAAELLHAARDTWTGTLLLVFQPAEERGAGAQAMVDGGLYDRVPVPDVVLGAHVTPHRAGSMGARVGAVASSANSMHITLYGRGGHASQPHRTVDPVTLAAYTITRLQTLVSREVSPAEHAVVTVAAVQAGTTENIIADRAVLKVNVRTFNEETRAKVLQGVKRVVDAECEASGSPKKAEFKTTSTFPPTHNDEAVTNALVKTLTAHFGDSYITNIDALPGSEDFSILATSVGKPCCFWIYGGTDPELYDRAKKEGRLAEDIPINHSAYFAPVVQPTLKVGVDGYAVAALTLLKK